MLAPSGEKRTLEEAAQVERAAWCGSLYAGYRLTTHEQPTARAPHAFARTPLPSSFLVALTASLSFPEQISGSLGLL